MKYLIGLILFTSCAYHINKGTTILASFSKDTIILMADSRAQHVTGDFSSIKYIDNVNKIRQVGKYFFEIAGTSHFRDIDLFEVVKSSFDSKKNLAENTNFLKPILLNIIGKYYENLTPLEMGYYDNSIKGSSIIDILIVGFEDGNRVVSQLEYKIEKSKINYEVSDGNDYSYFYNEGINGLIQGGYHNHIQNLVSKGYNVNNLHVKDLQYLISLEADADPHVGHGYNYVIITKDAHKWGKSY